MDKAVCADDAPFIWQAPQPKALPALRRSLIDHVGSDAFRLMMAQLVADGGHLLSGHIGLDAVEAADWVTDMSSRHLARARLISVDASMTDISMAAARKLPTFELRPESHPAPHGLMVFDKPIYSFPASAYVSHVVAVSWGPVLAPDGLGTWLMFWGAIDHEFLIRKLRRDLGVSYNDARREIYSRTSDLALVHDLYWPHEDADPPRSDSIEAGSAAGWAQIVRSAWAMYTARSKRKIAEVTPVSVGRPARRQAERDGFEHASEVDVIHVHSRMRTRAARKHSTGSAETGYKIDYRRFVGEHLRWQPYPSRNTVEPIMIADYIQGPVGAPFKSPRQKVYRLNDKPGRTQKPRPNPLIRSETGEPSR